MKGDFWTIVGLLLTNAGFLFGMWRYFDTRLSRVYGRLDEVKADTENKYVRKDNCALLHNNTADNLKGVVERMDARFDKLEKKVDDSFKLILDLLKK